MNRTNKLFICLFTVIACLSIISCGASGKKESKTIKVDNILVEGDSSDLISVIPGSYTLERSEDEVTLKVTLKVEKTSMSDATAYPGKLILLDSDGNDFLSEDFSLDGMEVDLLEYGAFSEFVKQPEGTSKEFTFVLSTRIRKKGEDILDAIMEKTAGFKMQAPTFYDVQEENKETADSTATETVNEESSESGQLYKEKTKEDVPNLTEAEVETLVKEYEICAKEYSDFKTNDGNIFSAEYAEIHEKYEKLEDLISEMRRLKTMSPEQSERCYAAFNMMLKADGF